MKKNPVLQLLMLIIISGLCPNNAGAQSKHKVINDPNYYETMPDKLTTRIYLSQKFLKFTIPSATQDDVEYKANTKMNLGMGVTWHNFSVNIFYGFAFLNKDTAKGETKGLDLQLHLYPRKWAIDLTTAFPKGYFLYPKGYAAPPGRAYYYRPDVKLSLISVSAYKVPNKEKFSYRAAIVQNEWQKKSAGSILYGGNAFHGTIKADSALVPKSIQGGFTQAGITNVGYTGVGAGFGYAFTLVMDQHFFITLSTVGNVNLTFTSEEIGGAKNKKTSIAPDVVAKAAIGYNSPTWGVSLNGLGSALWSKGDASPKNYYLPAGSLRLAISRKFDVKKKK